MIKKKLLYVGNKLSKHGNTTTVIETLSCSLVHEGFEVVVTSDKKNQLYRLLDMIATTLQKIFKVNYVLIDTYSTSSFYYALIISQICRLFKVKYLPILHGGNLPNRLKSSLFLSKIIFKNAYYNIAPSRYLLNEFSDFGFKNVVHIPNTISINDYRFESRNFETIKILWVRSFSEIYNPKMAINVFADLKKEFPNAKLCMVGPDKENLINECKELAKQRNVEVEFTGKLDKNEWLELSRDYNVFINTTHFDNTPISVIEAMALGLPVVSTNVGGIPYLLQDQKNAFLVNDSDVDAMVSAIKEIFSNSEIRTSIIKNARLLVESYDWSIVKDKWLEILK
ncbi:glycosyltransferase family 4 protein [Flavobacterium sp. SUN052]|uniref:glycosyltransferase family 4 protein n=1 Tax=Flavobacterium sp. SUN052 TaxID=3002441 RepID=UPI00237EBF91|nr:glycosyltransferase family 4 protein [Flavobacterium sp. SUN052]MEC4004385.1 glycosyltransferase family 4 protein [Flavobacterium sp. SUN052]